MNGPATIAARLVGLDGDRTIRVAALQSTDGEVRVVLHLVAAGPRSFLCSFKPERLRELATALDQVAGELGIQP